MTTQKQNKFGFKKNKQQNKFVCFFGFYGMSTFVGDLIPNPFLYI